MGRGGVTAPLPETLGLFQARLLEGNAGICPHLTNGGPFLKVYDHAYRARLAEVLGEDFPAVHTLLGDDAFAEAVGDYVESHPSRARSIRWLGERFAEFLRTANPWRGRPEIADMAAFEWGLGLAFDAADADALALDALAGVPPEAWPILTFTFHPALNTFQLKHDVARFHQAVVAERDPDGAPAPLEAPGTWAAWRDHDALIVRYRALDADEAAGLAVLLTGGDFAQLCEAVAAAGDADQAALRAATLLRHWIEAGWIVDIAAEGMSWS
jgi:hypothetical protein